MKKVAVLFLMAMVFSPVSVNAQQKEGVQSFGQEDDWRRKDGKPIVLQTMTDSVGAAGIANVTGAEAVFCYEVIAKPMSYTGYTIDNMALTGFCGLINQDLRDMLVTELFAKEENISLTTTENCMVSPKTILRFVKGVDYTDVMLSSPCHSTTIFYGGKIKTYNFKPGAEVIDTIIDSFHTKRMDFTSPALLGQLLPIGVVQNQEQQKAIEKTSEPVRNWETEEDKQEKKQSGWNNLQF